MSTAWGSQSLRAQWTLAPIFCKKRSFCWDISCIALGTVDFLGGMNPGCGLSCVLKDVWEHPWLLPGAGVYPSLQEWQHRVILSSVSRGQRAKLPLVEIKSILEMHLIGSYFFLLFETNSCKDLASLKWIWCHKYKSQERTRNHWFSIWLILVAIEYAATVQEKIKNTDGLTPNASNSLGIMKADSLCPVGETRLLSLEKAQSTPGVPICQLTPHFGAYALQQTFVNVYEDT